MRCKGQKVTALDGWGKVKWRRPSCYGISLCLSLLATQRPRLYFFHLRKVRHFTLKAGFSAKRGGCGNFGGQCCMGRQWITISQESCTNKLAPSFSQACTLLIKVFLFPGFFKSFLKNHNTALLEFHNCQFTCTVCPTLGKLNLNILLIVKKV